MSDLIVRLRLTYNNLAREAADRIAELEASVKFLLSFAPKDTVVPKGLDPTFYHTLSSEGDQKLANRINKIKAEVIE